MSCNSNWPIAERRRLLLALCALPLAGPAFASVEPPLPGLKRWGSADFRRFGFLVYRATLWAGDDPANPPLALRLDYRRTLAGKAIAEASVDEMRQFVGDAARLADWGRRMAQIFPDVRDGEHIIGLWTPEGARFVQDGRVLGEVRDTAFARAFFSIWLDPRTSAPALRSALLERPGR